MKLANITQDPRKPDITPFSGLVLPTGQAGDEGLFRFTNSDPQISEQNGASFTIQEFIFAQGAAANENNLDKITGGCSPECGRHP